MVLRLLLLALLSTAFLVHAHRRKLNLTSTVTENALMLEGSHGRPEDVTIAIRRLCVIAVATVFEKNNPSRIEMVLSAARTEDGLSERIRSLTDLIAETWAAHDRIKALGFSWTKTFGLNQEANELLAFLDHAGEYFDYMRFGYKSVIQGCAEKNEKVLESTMERITGELDQCTREDAIHRQRCDQDRCVVKSGGLCPEGTACQCAATVNKAFAMKVGGGIMAGMTGIKLTIGAFLGAMTLIPGGPIAGAGAVAAIPTGDTFLAMGVSAAVAKVAECSCQMQPCKNVGDSDRPKCAIVPESSSENKYAFLPMPGFKCAIDADGSCSTSLCAFDDFASARLGQHSSGVYSCDRRGLSNTLPAANGIEVNNTATARVEFYDSLGSFST